MIVALLLSERRLWQPGKGAGQTVALDYVTLSSRRYGLIGRPYRLTRNGSAVIPEERNRGLSGGMRRINGSETRQVRAAHDCLGAPS